MENHLIPILSAVLAVLFFVIYQWQRAIERKESSAVRSDLNEAKARGSHRAISQYPQINRFLCIGCASCVFACPEDDVIGMVDNIAQVINGARCVGHGRCEEVCPVGAIHVGLGNIALRPDIPVLSPVQETSIPNVFIAGELGGISLIRNAIEQGTRVANEIAKRCRATPARGNIHDLLIVGAGPAGLAASLAAAQNNLRFMMIDQGDLGGAISQYPRRKLALVQDLTIPLHGKIKSGEYEKEFLMDLWQKLVEKNHLPFQAKTPLQSLESRNGVLYAGTPGGTFMTRHVILALGRRGAPRKLDVPGEDEKKVFYQLVDAATYNKQHLLVVGGGDSAIEAATALANQSGNVVTLSYRKDAFFRLKTRNAERIETYLKSGRVKVIFSSDVKHIEPNAVTLAVHGPTESELKLKNDFVFVFAGGQPPFAKLKDWGISFGGNDALRRTA